MKLLIQLFISFLQIGFFSIGGGYAAIPLIQQQVVDFHAWMTLAEYSDIITISQMTPGPLAVNTSTFVGMRLGGIQGAVIATAGCTLSGILLSYMIYRCYQRFKNSAYMQNMMKALTSISAGLIVSSAAVLLKMAFLKDESFDYPALMIFIILLCIIRKYQTNPIYILLLSGMTGCFLYL